MSYQSEFRQLQYFLSVAEELHYRKAAERLFISQPGLSKQISQLEKSLGIRLFERNSRKVKLTESGKHLKSEVAEAFRKLNFAIEHAKLIEKGYRGQLKLGYIGSAMQNIIPDFMINTKNDLSNIQFILNEMDNEKQIEGILKYDIDIGFVRVDRVPRHIEIQPVFVDTFSLVLPKDHKIDQENFKDLSQLKDETFILFDSSYSKSYYEKVMQIFEESGFTPIVSHYTVHAYTIYRLIENNFGISIVPSALKRGYDMKIKFIELNNIGHSTTLRMIWNKKNQNPVLKHVLKLINTKITT